MKGKKQTVFSISIFDKELFPRIYKEIQINRKKTNGPIFKKRTKDYNRYFKIKYPNGQSTH